MKSKKDKLQLNSIIESGDFKNKKVVDIVTNNKKDIFKMIKSGFYFDDEVLTIAGIKKIVKDVKTSNQFVEHEKDSKVYEIDKTPLHKILKEIATIEGYTFNENINKEESENVDIDEDDDINDSEIIEINDVEE